MLEGWILLSFEGVLMFSYIVYISTYMIYYPVVVFDLSNSSHLVKMRFYARTE